MMELKKEISQAKFERFTRVVFCVHVTTDKNTVGSTSYFLTKNSAYELMEKIKNTLESDHNLDWFTLDDLDVKPSTLVSKAGYVYELLTLPIVY